MIKTIKNFFRIFLVHSNFRWVYLVAGFFELVVLLSFGLMTYSTFWAAEQKVRHNFLASNARVEITDAYIGTLEYIVDPDTEISNRVYSDLDSAQELIDLLMDGFPASPESEDEQLQESGDPVEEFQVRAELRILKEHIKRFRNKSALVFSEYNLDEPGAARKAQNIVGKSYEEFISQMIKVEKGLADSVQDENRRYHLIFIFAFATILVLSLAAAIFLYIMELNRNRQFEELQKVSRALDISEKNYRELVQSANSIIMRINASGEITFMNDYGCRFFQYSEKEILGRNIIGTIIPSMDTRGRNMDEMIDRLIDNPNDYTTNENENIKKDGSRVWISWSNRIIRTVDDEPGEVLSIGTDVTERKIVEDAMRKLDEQYRIVVEQANEGIAIVMEGAYKFTNPVFFEITGYSEEELMNVKPEDIIHPDDREQLQDLLSINSSDGSQASIHELRFIHKSGAHRWAEIKTTSFLWENRIATIAFISDITERKNYEQKLKEMATTDPLTGALNRRRFMELCKGEVERAKRYQHPLSLIMMDIDHFKKINDTYGHAAGDEVLKNLVSLSMSEIRLSDQLGRLGGEEFCLLLPMTDLDAAILVAERLRGIFEQVVTEYNDQQISFTVSFGVSEINPDDKNIESVLKRADDELYCAKNSGRNIVMPRKA